MCQASPATYDCPCVATQERFEFLAKYRHVVPEEDFEVAMKAYEWPKKFVSIMKEAATKATSGLLHSTFYMSKYQPAASNMEADVHCFVRLLCLFVCA